MFKQLFSAGPLMVYPLIALGTFITVFVTRAIAMTRTSKEEIAHLERLPLASESNEGELR